MTQCEKILRHIAERGSITTWEAMRDLGVMRLASRVCELRKTGHPIVAERVESVNRWGEKVHFNRYRLGGIQ